MFNKKIKYAGFLFLLAIVFSLTGCTKEKEESKNKIIEVSSGSDIVIKTDEITENATFYNYDADGVTIQIFAVKATDGTVRIAFNTCGACNPSPMAFFVQHGDYFECQNCKNRFHRDEIGLKKSFGCSPIAILNDDKEFSGNTITIKSTFIETYKQKFESINIYTN